MIGGVTILVLQACMIGQPAKCEQLTIEISDPDHKLYNNKQMCQQYGAYEARLFNLRNFGIKAINKWQCIKKSYRTIEA